MIIRPYKNFSPIIHESAFIAENAVITGDVEIGKDTNIWYGCVMRGDVHHIRIGERTNIQDGSVIHVTSGLEHGTIIGNDVTIGHMALLHACIIEDLGFVGMQACVMDQAVVESRAMVAAGSLVTPGKRIPSGQLWGGRPAKYMRDLTPEELDYLQVSADKYVQVSKEYL